MNTALSNKPLTNFVYKDNEQILIEIKKIMLETKTTQREIAAKLGIKPQGLTKMLNKKISVSRMLKKYWLLWIMIKWLILNNQHNILECGRYFLHGFAPFV